jgi:histidine ammonia-lyase
LRHSPAAELNPREEIELDGASLSLEGLAAVVSGERSAVLAPRATVRMRAARNVLVKEMERGIAVYGTTTGVAERKRVSVDGPRQSAFNRRLISGHRVAQGPPASPLIVRAAMLCLANSLAKGMSGVRPEIVELFLEALDDGFVPLVGSLGSVGEGDIGPLADLAHGLLDRSGLVLEAGEGLALMNSNAFSTGWSALALLRAERLLDSTDVAAAMDLEAFAANLSPWHDIVVACRSSPGIETTIGTVRQLLSGSVLWEPGRARNLQDPMTFRCIPQVHGAAREALTYARAIVEAEINAVQGNPVVVVEEERLVSVGNFDAIALSAALDFVRIALAPVIGAASERTVKLLQEPTSGLAAGLAEAPELGDDALAELAVASPSLAVEARMLAQPVSLEPASTFIAEGIEDRATMAPLSARRLDEMVGFAARVVAIELAVAAQAIDLRGLSPLGQGTAAAYERVRSLVSFSGRGAGPPQIPDALIDAVMSGELPAGTG